MGIGGDRQNAGVAQQPAAVRFRGQRHAAEVAAADARDAVVPGQPLVEKGVVRPQQVERAAVLADDAFKEQLGLAPHRLAQVVVEVREQPQVGVEGVEVPEVQPLAGEIRHEGLRAWIGKQAARLRFEHLRLHQFAALRQIEQLVVRQAAPQEKRQPRGERVAVQRIDAAGR